MHQCLVCGHTFSDDEAIQVLRGCRQCKGTRFYYTEAPMTEAERKEVLRRSQGDIREVVAEVLQREAPETAAGLDDWAELKPKDLRRLVKEVQRRRDDATHGEPGSPGPRPASGWEYEDAQPLGIPTQASRREVEEALEAQAKAGRKPDTVEAGDGAYDIDVKGLLERNPIVVHKDGAYLIHLPSLFGQNKQ